MSGVSRAAAVPVADGLFAVDPPALLAGRCVACGALRFPLRSACATCQRTELEPVALSRDGTVYTYTIMRASPPGYSGPVPYAVGVVELPEGLRVTSTLTCEDLMRIEIGRPCTFELLELPGADGEILLSYAFRVS